MKINRVIILLTCLILWTACSRVPVSGRRQFRMLPEGMVSNMATSNYQAFMDEYPVLHSGDPRADMVHRTGDRIANAVVAYLEDTGQSRRVREFDWEFNLVDSEQVNAWAMPGGKVAIYTGILDLTRDEEGLAVVMAHEIAHAVARHGNERMSQQLLVVMGAVSLEVAMSEKPEMTRDIFMMAYGAGSTLGSLAYSRQHEYEADALGMVFMGMAGYDPSRTITFWERMLEYSGGSDIPQFLSTHPSNKARVQAAKDFLPEAMNYYNSI